jgi:hypothetical protein
MDIKELFYTKFPGVILKCVIKEQREEIFDKWRIAKIFLLDLEDKSYVVDEGIVTDNIETEGFSFALPFKTCYFEIGHFDTFFLKSFMPKEQIIKEYTSFLVDEISPGVFHVIAPYAIKDKNAIGVDISLVGHNVKETNLSKLFALQIEYICKAIHNSTLGEEYVHKNIVLKDTPYGKYNHKISTVVRLKHKSYKSDVKPLISKTINWSHSWWVRGHWRKIEGVGKNRQNEYNINGFTWVTEHFKGPEDKEIINKTYEN